MEIFLAFVISLIFFVWFGRTLTAIRYAVEATAEHAQYQSRILEKIRDKIAPEEEVSGSKPLAM